MRPFSLSLVPSYASNQDLLAQNREAKRRFDARMEELSDFVELQVDANAERLVAPSQTF